MTTTPSQRAREAAEHLYYNLSGGTEDFAYLSKALDKFEAETLERAAEVADEAEQRRVRLFEQNDNVANAYRASEANYIADAIRNLIGERP